MNQSYSMFDLVLHVLSQFTTGLLYPLMMLLMSILSASLSRQLNDSVLTPAQTAHSAPPGSGLDGMINFLVFYEALVLWGYTATAGTQDQTEGKIIKYKVCGPLCPITWCFPSLPPLPTHASPPPVQSSLQGATLAASPQASAWCQHGPHHSSPRLVPPGLGVKHKLSTQNLKQLSTALTGRVALVNVQCFKCLGLTFR